MQEQGHYNLDMAIAEVVCSSVCVCMCEDKGPWLTLPRTDGNISLCSTPSLFLLPSHKGFVYYVFLICLC